MPKPSAVPSWPSSKPKPLWLTLRTPAEIEALLDVVLVLMLEQEMAAPEPFDVLQMLHDLEEARQ